MSRRVFLKFVGSQRVDRGMAGLQVFKISVWIWICRNLRSKQGMHCVWICSTG